MTQFAKVGHLMLLIGACLLGCSCELLGYALHHASHAILDAGSSFWEVAELSCDRLFAE
jgi:hypothetical protein